MPAPDNKATLKEKNVCQNRKAFHEYFIGEGVEAGLVLNGPEVKSLRAGQGSLVESFAQVKDGEAWRAKKSRYFWRISAAVSMGVFGFPEIVRPGAQGRIKCDIVGNRGKKQKRKCGLSGKNRVAELLFKNANQARTLHLHSTADREEWEVRSIRGGILKTEEKAGEIAERVCAELRRELGENLFSCVLYGSAVRGAMVARKSDINLLVVLNRSTPAAHRVMGEAMRRFPKVDPFILSKGELARSRAVFALKFRSIGRNYRILYGEDPLVDFAPSAALLLFLCEQSLRNVRLRLTHAYVKGCRRHEVYARTLVAQYPAIFTALHEVLLCAGVEVPAEHADRPQAVGRALGTDAGVLRDLYEFRLKPRGLSAKEMEEIHSNLHRLLSAALDWIRQQWPQAIEIQ